MPRDPNGNYQLPLPPVEPGTVIESVWANTTMDDIKTALTYSLSRRGNGGMLVPFQNASGNRQAPGITWTNEETSGIYRETVGDMRIAALTTDVMRWTPDGAYMWDTENGVWRRLMTQGGPDGPEDGTVDGETIAWSATNDRWLKTDILRVLGQEDPGQENLVAGIFRGFTVDQKESNILVVDTLPEVTDPNTLYIVRD